MASEKLHKEKVHKETVNKDKVDFHEYCKVRFAPSNETRHFRIVLLKANVDGLNYYTVTVEYRLEESWFEIIDLQYETDNKESAIQCVRDYEAQIKENLEQVMRAARCAVERHEGLNKGRHGPIMAKSSETENRKEHRKEDAEKDFLN